MFGGKRIGQLDDLSPVAGDQHCSILLQRRGRNCTPTERGQLVGQGMYNRLGQRL